MGASGSLMGLARFITCAAEVPFSTARAESNLNATTTTSIPGGRPCPRRLSTPLPTSPKLPPQQTHRSTSQHAA